MSTPTARKVSAVLRAAGFGQVRSSTITPGRIRVEQRYTAAGALAASDTRARRERRARLIADQLTAEGFTAIVVYDRVTVTAGPVSSGEVSS